MESEINIELERINNDLPIIQLLNINKFEIDDVILKIEYTDKIVNIKFTGKNIDENIFFELYEYINLILGYFPKIKSIDPCEQNIENIQEKYKTNGKYIENNFQFIFNMDKNNFIESFKKFREIKKKINFQLNMFYQSTMSSNCYPEIAISNILQTMEGIFDCLYNNSNNKIFEKTKIKEIKEIIKTTDLSTVEITDFKKEILIDYLVLQVGKINGLFFIDKIKLLIGNLDKNLFYLERNLDDSNRYNYEKLLNLFKDTRHQFSHVCEKDKKNVLSGKESTIYIYKLIIAIRLILLKEIGLDDIIEKNILKTSIRGYENKEEFIEECKTKKRELLDNEEACKVIDYFIEKFDYKGIDGWIKDQLLNRSECVNEK